MAQFPRTSRSILASLLAFAAACSPGQRKEDTAIPILPTAHANPPAPPAPRDSYDPKAYYGYDGSLYNEDDSKEATRQFLRAVRENDEDAALRAIRSGANIHYHMHTGDGGQLNMLALSALRGWERVTYTLLRKDPNLIHYLTDPGRGTTILQECVTSDRPTNCEGVLQRLIATKPNLLTLRNGYGESVLAVAIDHRNEGFIQFLRTHPAWFQQASSLTPEGPDRWNTGQNITAHDAQNRLAPRAGRKAYRDLARAELAEATATINEADSTSIFGAGKSLHEVAERAGAVLRALDTPTPAAATPPDSAVQRLIESAHADTARSR